MSLRKSGTAAAVLAGALALGGCSPAPQEPAAGAPEATMPTPPVVKSPVSINAVMVRLVDHASHELWNVEREGHQPKTDADWANVEHHATQVAASGALIGLEGTGTNDRDWVSREEWQRLAKAVSDAGAAALTAAQAKDLTALVTANGQLVESCEACHKEFKPDLPSEGIVHAHMH